MAGTLDLLSGLATKINPIVGLGTSLLGLFGSKPKPSPGEVAMGQLAGMKKDMYGRIMPQVMQGDLSLMNGRLDPSTQAARTMALAANKNDLTSAFRNAAAVLGQRNIALNGSNISSGLLSGLVRAYGDQSARMRTQFLAQDDANRQAARARLATYAMGSDPTNTYQNMAQMQNARTTAYNTSMSQNISNALQKWMELGRDGYDPNKDKTTGDAGNKKRVKGRGKTLYSGYPTVGNPNSNSVLS